MLRVDGFSCYFLAAVCVMCMALGFFFSWKAIVLYFINPLFDTLWPCKSDFMGFDFEFSIFFFFMVPGCKVGKIYCTHRRTVQR